MNVIYFSPTGGTKRVVELVASVWNEKINEIDLSQDSIETRISQELTIVAVPSYAGRVPKIAMERLLLLKANKTPAILVVTYGNRAYEDTLLELKNIVSTCGFHPIAAISAVCEHSIMHEFGKGRPNVQDSEEIISFAEQIKTTYTQHCSLQLQVSGKYPYREYGGLPLYPKTSKKCTACGLCISSCPVHAISLNEIAQTDKGRCITCMRCIQQCPNHARSLSAPMVKGASKMLHKQCSEPKKNELFLPQ